eukprot:g27911.t1
MQWQQNFNAKTGEKDSVNLSCLKMASNLPMQDCATVCCRTFSLVAYLNDPGFWASLINIFASTGYVVADILSATSLDISTESSITLFITLAVLFLIDALLYMAAWYQTSDRSLDFWAYGEVFNIIGSAIFVVSACIPAELLTYNPTYSQMIFARSILALTNVLGMVTFSFDSLFYMTAWFHGTDKSESVYTKLKTADTWAEILNVFPSLLYLFATIWFLLDLLQASLQEDSIMLSIAGIEARTERLFKAYAAADIMYTIDACCYAYGYFRDKAVELRAVQPSRDTEGKNQGAQNPTGQEECTRDKNERERAVGMEEEEDNQEPFNFRFHVVGRSP